MTAIANFVAETSEGTGTGNLTLVNSVGRVGFSSAHGTGSGNKFYYGISNRATTEWEYGIGYMSDATTLVRETVIGSSNAGSAVNFSAGTKDVVNDLPAEYQLGGTSPTLQANLNLQSHDVTIDANQTTEFRSNANATPTFAIYCPTNVDAYLRADGNISGNYPALTAVGSQANIGMFLLPKGNAGVGVAVNNGTSGNASYPALYIQKDGHTDTSFPFLGVYNYTSGAGIVNGCPAGAMIMYTRNTNSALFEAGRIEMQGVDVTAGSEDGAMRFARSRAGTPNVRGMQLDAGLVVGASGTDFGEGTVNAIAGLYDEGQRVAAVQLKEGTFSSVSSVDVRWNDITNWTEFAFFEAHFYDVRSTGNVYGYPYGQITKDSFVSLITTSTYRRGYYGLYEGAAINTINSNTGSGASSNIGWMGTDNGSRSDVPMHWYARFYTPSQTGRVKYYAGWGMSGGNQYAAGQDNTIYHYFGYEQGTGATHGYRQFFDTTCNGGWFLLGYRGVQG